MKALSYILTAVVAAILVLLPVAKKLPNLKRDQAKMELIHTRHIVEKRLADINADLNDRLRAFSDQVAQDREFSMKVIVEQNAAAPEVTEIAGKAMQTMGLTILEVTDASSTILSSGHFAASAGGSVQEKASQLTEELLMLSERIKGAEILTMQTKIAFTCADQRFYCIGGMIVDDAFIQRLTPRDGVQLLLRQGTDVIGMDDIEAMSNVEDNTIIINDETYLAASLTVSTVHDQEPIELILIMDRPAQSSLVDLF